jgi:hypothetical protein
MGIQAREVQEGVQEHADGDKQEEVRAECVSGVPEGV